MHMSALRNEVGFLRTEHNNALPQDRPTLVVLEEEVKNLLLAAVVNVGMLDAGYGKITHSLFLDPDNGHGLFLCH